MDGAFGMVEDNNSSLLAAIGLSLIHILNVRGYELSVRKADAAMIEVE